MHAKSGAQPCFKPYSNRDELRPKGNLFSLPPTSDQNWMRVPKVQSTVGHDQQCKRVSFDRLDTAPGCPRPQLTHASRAVMVQQPKASDVKRIKQSRQTQRHALKRSSKRLRTSALTAADVLGQRDLAQHIFSFLSPRELARVAGVCRLWRDISSCTRLWEPICQVLAGADRLTVRCPSCYRHHKL